MQEICPALILEESNDHGRGRDKEFSINLLEFFSDDKIKVICIVEMDGVGKIIFAQLVYYDDRVRSQIDIQVSDKFDTFGLMKKSLESFRGCQDANV